MSLSEGSYFVLPVDFLDSITNPDLLSYLESLPRATLIDEDTHTTISAVVWNRWDHSMDEVDPDDDGDDWSDFVDFFDVNGTQIWLRPVSGGMGGDLSDII